MYPKNYYQKKNATQQLHRQALALALAVTGENEDRSSSIQGPAFLTKMNAGIRNCGGLFPLQRSYRVGKL